MTDRRKGIIGTIAAVVLCGCPGLLLCVFGGSLATGAPVSTELNGVTQTTTLPAGVGIALLCIGLIFILIPGVVGFLTWMDIIVGLLRPRATPQPPTMSGPLPPAS